MNRVLDTHRRTVQNSPLHRFTASPLHRFGRTVSKNKHTILSHNKRTKDTSSFVRLFIFVAKGGKQNIKTQVNRLRSIALLRV
ncbi:hypothetical protein [Treponema maltophilum]|uniref:hypothetical protein n=1 Tax=Treponema maltophilum TaxID=51160 RepID=UPI0012EB8DE3|nr:hypothetical protein [Treponema maltophilum]